MSPSPVVNVVRYSALIGGIGYGILHRRTLQKEFDERILKKEQKVQDDLIKKAKEEYAKLQAAKAPVAPSSTVVTNPDDPNFDLEKAFAQWEKQ
ncbi:F1F0 ATP synthase subunit e, mitochondrial [Malassezia japonica]|uniref:ATP synthase F(0) complex subunit e, mitochondrial n=1 Tax=Malassezia japonica TaxID=223818 RepID=A0AAF0F855_9BASI|nr:F1F0 ATP synthase subunit e, mitochondrial [Malassezia japonica]WFD40042.1 F1F0 ATP synthase subunit e, mitochondrial [Malassezia japonica]